MTKTEKKKGKSPYAKYGKLPFIYSDHLNNWTAAVKSGDKEAADKADLKWRRSFAPCTLDADGQFDPHWRLPR